MENRHFNAIGVVEINFLTNALVVLDEMLKASEVHLVACEKRLGGRMVSIIVGGDTSAVNAAIETAHLIKGKVGEENIKVAVTIPNPHKEIRKLLNLIQSPNQVQKELEKNDKKVNKEKQMNQAVKEKETKEKRLEIKDKTQDNQTQSVKASTNKSRDKK